MGVHLPHIYKIDMRLTMRLSTLKSIFRLASHQISRGREKSSSYKINIKICTLKDIYVIYRPRPVNKIFIFFPTFASLEINLERLSERA